jgi:hypothetical protein
LEAHYNRLLAESESIKTDEAQTECFQDLIEEMYAIMAIEARRNNLPTSGIAKPFFRVPHMRLQAHHNALLAEAQEFAAAGLSEQFLAIMDEATAIAAILGRRNGHMLYAGLQSSPPMLRPPFLVEKDDAAEPISETRQ